MANYADEVLESIRGLMRNSGVVLPPPGAARAATVAIDPAIAARAARQAELPVDAQEAMRLAQEQSGAARLFSPQAGLRTNDGAPAFDRFVSDNLATPAPAAPDMDLGTPLWDQMSKRAGAYDNMLRGRTANLPNMPFAKPAQAAIQDANANAAKMRAGMAASAERGELAQDVGTIGAGLAGAGALGAGAVALVGAGGPKKAEATPRYTTDIDMPGIKPPPPPAPPKKPVDPLFEDKGALTNTGGTAELANEARPAPAVQASTDPREQAQEMIKQLNAGHRAGTITPAQDQQMRAEIDRLLALSNQKRNAMTPQQAQGSSDPHTQAQALIAQLNDMRKKAGGEVPQAQQMMAEVRRLQAMGDQQRNAAQTR